MFKQASGRRAGGKKKAFGRPSLGVNLNVLGKIKDVTEGIGKVVVDVGHTTRKTFIGSPQKSGDEGFGKRKIWPTLGISKVVCKPPDITAKTEEEHDFVLRALQSNFLFSEMEDGPIDELVGVFEKHSVKKEDCIIRQGDAGDYFYILFKGEVSFEVDGGIVGSSQDREEPYCYFGELALLYSAARAATVLADTDCVLFRLDHVNFRHVMRTKGQTEDQEKMSLLKSTPVLQELEDASLRKLVAAITTLKFPKGETIFKKGDEMTNFIIIQSGKVQATDITLGGSKYEDIVMGPGELQSSFGWQAMMGDGERIAGTVIAKTDVAAFAIDFETFRRSVGKYEELIQRGLRKRQVLAITVFRDSKLDDNQVSGLLDLMTHQQYGRKKVLFREGASVDAALCFVRKGSVVLESKHDKYTKTIEEGGYFGENSLLVDQNKDGEQRPLIVSKFTATASKDASLDLLSLEDCRKVVDTTLLGLGKPAKVSALDKKLRMEDLTRHVMLGAGSFGQVWLASSPSGDKNKPRIYALKVQSKHQLIETGQAEGVVGERNIMASLKCPFIIRLYNTFQDGRCVYMITSLLQGGELGAIIPDVGLFESDAMFYAAGILEGLTYMHRRHIIHRDLKPENVLIDAKGYPVLIDLGFAKYVPGKTYTFCGTPMYIAPEVISYKGTDKGADHWSWACMVYEMVTGQFAFYKKGMDELALFKRICRGQYELSGWLTYEFKLLMISMFEPDRSRRLGSGAGGWKDIFDSPWFDEIDFHKLRRQEIEAPWVPDLKNPLDSSKFTDCSKLEDKMKTNEPALSKEQQQIFKTFGPVVDQIGF